LSKQLKISDDLSLPLETVTQAIGILAKRRAGKSYAARRLAEQLFKAGQQIVIVDPKGDWWGIRSSADGKGPGLPIVILGGERGDVPLEVNAGEVVAKLVVEERVSVLLDLSLLRKHEVSTFMGHFLESLYRLKAREQYRTPLMLIVDEADAIAPQKPFKGEERMLGAAEDIVRRGGQRGIGCALITQRSAVLNKNVLTQIQMLVVLRTIAPQDLAAIDAWIDVHGTEDERKILKGSLPSLPTGDAWFWSPGWPTTEGIFERAHVLPIETFDSGATPKPGEKRVEPKNLADVDLDALSRQMAATIEKAKAEDPKELRKQIADLKKQLTAKTPAPAKPVEMIKEVEKLIVKDAQIKRLESFGEKLATVGGELVSFGNDLIAELRKVNTNGHKPAAQGPSQFERTLPERKPAPTQRTHRQPREVGDLKINKTQQRILDALAWYESIGIPEPSNIQVGAIALIDPTGGYFSNTVGPLTTAGLIERRAGTMSLTDEGRAVAVVPDSIGSLDEYHDVLRQRVRKARSASGRTVDMLDAIIASGAPMSTEELGIAVGIDHTGGYFSNTIGPLSTLGLIERNQGMVRPTDVLFPPELA
jgi:uncharacterized protein DUF87